MSPTEQEEDITYKELREIQQKEKRSSLLTRIIPGFYRRVFDFIDSLEQEYKEKELPSQKRRLVEEELENMRKAAMSIYEHREKKIVQAALAALRGANPSLSNMTKEEKPLFEGIKNALQETRSRLLEKQDPTDDVVSSEEESPQRPGSEASEHDTSAEETKDAKAEEHSERKIVRVKRDVPEFIGPDMKEYNLKRDDVVALPDNIAGTMIEKNAADQVNTRWL